MTSRCHSLVVFGTRPEAIKLAPVIRALRSRPSHKTTVCCTGQHRELLVPIMRDLEIEPDINLGLMQPGQSLNRLFGRLMMALDDVLLAETPDTVIVQGDTTTVCAASLAGFQRGCQIAHVEAGLRTDDRRSPFPEEMNRRLTGAVADVHFAPTAAARSALITEGVDPATILVTGNTGIDSVIQMAEARRGLPAPPETDTGNAPLVLVTAHRRENFGEPYIRICMAVRRLATKFPDHVFVFPVHLNPDARGCAQRELSGINNVRLVEALGYATMVHAMSTAALILTDSGGVQEEAPSLGTPVLVLRESTERPEAIIAGGAVLVGTDADRIVETATAVLQSDRPRQPLLVYGDGHASERIARYLVDGKSDVEPFVPPELAVGYAN